MRTGLWVPALPGVFRDAAVRVSAAQRRWAALLWAAPGATLSHRSAAAVYRLEGIEDRKPEVTIVYGRGLRHSDVVVHRSNTLLPADIRRVDRLVVTTPERTLLDLAGEVEPEAFEVAFESARRVRLVTAESVGKRLVELRGAGHAGCALVGEVVDSLAGQAPNDSVLDVKVARLLRGAVAPFIQQHEGCLFGRRYRLDFAWPEFRVALECDGRGRHANRGAFQRDRVKWTAPGAAGWRVLVATWDDVT